MQFFMFLRRYFYPTKSLLDIGSQIELLSYKDLGVSHVLLAVRQLWFFFAISGIVLCSRMYRGQPTIGIGFGMDAIEVFVLGGTFLGMLIIRVLNNELKKAKVLFLLAWFLQLEQE